MSWEGWIGGPQFRTSLSTPHAMLKDPHVDGTYTCNHSRQLRTSSVLLRAGTIGGPSRTPIRPPLMKSGDVLVSRPTARADIDDISVVPGVVRVSTVCYEDGMETVASSRVNWRWMAGSPATTLMSCVSRNTGRSTAC
jgi:hypothetical protein